MNYLVSMSSNQFGMTAYAKDKFGDDSDYAKRELLSNPKHIVLCRKLS